METFLERKQSSCDAELRVRGRSSDHEKDVWDDLFLDDVLYDRWMAIEMHGYEDRRRGRDADRNGQEKQNVAKAPAKVIYRPP